MQSVSLQVLWEEMLELASSLPRYFVFVQLHDPVLMSTKEKSGKIMYNESFDIKQ